mgnify:CR=1 FL=1
MQESEKMAVVGMLTEIILDYPSSKVEEKHAEHFASRLASYPFNAVMYALSRISDDGRKFYPTLPEIREKIEYWLYLRDKFSIMPEVAFKEAIEELQTFDPGRGPRFANAAISDVVDKIGMRALAANPDAHKAGFIEMYKDTARKHFAELTKISDRKPKEIKA